jgi:hypothetical protein
MTRGLQRLRIASERIDVGFGREPARSGIT